MAHRVLVSQYIFPEAVEQLRDAGLEVTARSEDAPLPSAELRRAVTDVDALICLLTDRIDAAALARMKPSAILINTA